jgi:hypothetical protein
MLYFNPKLKIRRFQISDAPEALNFGVMETLPCILAMFVRLGTNVDTEQVLPLEAVSDSVCMTLKA